MTGTKRTSPLPYFLLFALFWGTGILNNKYPSYFFPSIPIKWVWGVTFLGGLYSAFVAIQRWDVLFKQGERTKALVERVTEGRQAAENPTESDVLNAGRTISRLVRNADQDLREIQPDFSLASIKHLQRALPELLNEIENEEDARIRLGIVGTYLGETYCRNGGWKWFFRPDPSLRQFSYLASVIRKQGKEIDPFAWAGDLMTGKRGIDEIMKEIQ